MHPRYSPIAAPFQQEPQQQMGETSHHTVREGTIHSGSGVRLSPQFRPQMQGLKNYINVSH